MFAIPVIAIVSSMLVFGERISATEWLGIGSIGIGLVILSARAVRVPPRTERVDSGAGDRDRLMRRGILHVPELARCNRVR
jgi:hypothetical protein